MSALVPGARSTAEIAEKAGVDARRVEVALRKLRGAGLVAGRPGEMLVRHDVFERAARVERVAEDPFLRDGRLVRLPGRHGRRRAVLEQVCTAFEPGRRYPEREVAEVLGGWCAGGEVDHVTVRRYLVDEGLLDRADGVHWRSGGPVEAPAG
ncbi:DUF2087 domain-containing protein [Actinosynnema sp. NPDC047251]|uniref:DUF2087 domain-containing protein n=1 Tax=Saccharothrix espanaensis (strain ATCC 51144 / DSM 44229 / JCM 9112 / NBRC 15066 / NRRL 15764) TaxID=1179773 RepID=K0K047_SACES|nr:DUF2087 domain-containing protein [Saccharothrix espanaensis]CCH29928.1 hypothetical protein BN6_26150 [Saccharothrix espanaensis DSM 44229]